MKVKIIQRSVYHKIEEIEVEIPDDCEDVQNYLVCNEDLWVDELDKKMDKAEYEWGFGLGDGMEDDGEESEMRYEFDGNGGHL